MTIHVYGDSFGADTGEGTWPWKLSELQKEKLICNAVGGTGPNHALEKFFDTELKLKIDQIYQNLLRVYKNTIMYNVINKKQI